MNEFAAKAGTEMVNSFQDKSMSKWMQEFMDMKGIKKGDPLTPELKKELADHWTDKIMERVEVK